MSITVREPRTLAERIKDEHRAGNRHACAVSIDGSEPVYGEATVIDPPDPDHYTAFAQHSVQPGYAEWHVKAEGYFGYITKVVTLAFGTSPDQLNYTGNAIMRSVDLEVDKLPMNHLMGCGPLTYDASGEPA